MRLSNFIMVLLMLASVTAHAQQDGNFKRVSIKDSLWLNGKWVKGFSDDSTHGGAADNIIPTQSAVKRGLIPYVTISRLIDSLALRLKAADTASLSNRINARITSADAASTYIPISQKAAANGVATLGGNGKIPSAQIPAIAISETFVTASQSAMLALTAETGDVAVRTDLSKSFILSAEPASTLGNWQELLTPTAPVQSVNGQTGNVSLTTNNISEGANQYWTTARGDARYPLLSGSYANPTWISSLDFSKLYNLPAPQSTIYNADGSIAPSGTTRTVTSAGGSLLFSGAESYTLNSFKSGATTYGAWFNLNSTSTGSIASLRASSSPGGMVYISASSSGVPFAGASARRIAYLMGDASTDNSKFSVDQDGFVHLPKMRFANNVATDSILGTDVNGQLRLVHKNTITPAIIGAAPASGSSNYLNLLGSFGGAVPAHQLGGFWMSWIGRSNGGFEVLKNGSNTYSANTGHFSLYNSDLTRGAVMQLNGDGNPGIATWIHDGANFTKRFELFSNGSFQFPNVMTATGSTGDVSVIGAIKSATNSGIRGTGTGSASTAIMAFYEADGTTRQGFVGKASTLNSSIYVHSDAGQVMVNGQVPFNAASSDGYGLQVLQGNLTQMTVGGDAGSGFIQTWSKPLRINSQGNNTFINPNSGNVGIGNTAPGVKLDVTGDVRASNLISPTLYPGLTTSASTIFGGALNSYQGGQIAVYGGQHSVPANQGSIRMFAGTNSTGINAERLTILGTGQIGIGGVTSPTAVFEIGNSVSTELQFTGASGANIYQSGSTQPLYINTNTGAMYLGANGSGSQHVTILSNGNVGLNNTAPTEKLDVDGNILATGTVNSIGGKVKEGGAAARMGVANFATGVMTATVNTTAITANSRVFLTVQTTNGIVGGIISTPYISARVAGTSFTIRWDKNSSSDVGTIAWMIVEPF